MIVSVNDFKSHSIVEHDDDDGYINNILSASEYSIAHDLGVTNLTGSYETAGPYSGSLAPDLKHAIYILAAQLYENREPVSPTRMVEVPYTLDYLINPYKVWSR